jgi:hypothetical protein
VVGLSKYAGISAPEAHIQAYIHGYAEGGGRLTAAEIRLVPQLIILRVLSNVIYFAGRAAAGEDSVEPLVGRAKVYEQRVRWLQEKAGWLRGLLAEVAEPEGPEGAGQ